MRKAPAVSAPAPAIVPGPAAPAAEAERVTACDDCGRDVEVCRCWWAEELAMDAYRNKRLTR